jgi:hypothetical protein
MASVMQILHMVFSFKACMGIVAVAGMPETRINLNFFFFFFLFSLLWVAIICITFVNL